VRKLLEQAASIVPLDHLAPRDLKGSVSPEALELKPPKRILTLRDGRPHTLMIGAEGAAPGQVYARIDNDPSVYLVSGETAALAFAPVSGFRDPRPLPQQPDHLEEIVMTRRGGLQVLKLRRERGVWKIVEPLAAPADATAASSWIGGVLSAKILRWMPGQTDSSSCGLEPPELTLTAREEGGEPSRMEIGSEVPGTPGARFARCPDRPGIFVLDNASDLTGISPSKHRSRQPGIPSPDTVDRIVIGTSTGAIDLRRKPGSDDWECRGRIVPAEAVSAWFGRLQGLTATSFEPATPECVMLRGLDFPATSLRLVAHLSENSAEESAGEMVLGEYAFGSDAGGRTALREGKAADLMILSSESVRELLSGPEGAFTLPLSPDMSAGPRPSPSPDAP
jgi:hypothetical protein